MVHRPGHTGRKALAKKKSVLGRVCEKGIVMLPRGVSERVADNLFGCRAFGRRRHLEGM